MAKQEQKSSDHLAIWRDLAEVPAECKQERRDGGRSFTAIDTYWKIRRLTEQFGPIGEGWGAECTYEVVDVPPDTKIVVCYVRAWVASDSHACGKRYLLEGGGVGGTAKLAYRTSGRGGQSGYLKVDHEAWKKAFTDGLTKSFSYIGLGADVFMRLFEDDKYSALAADEGVARAEQQGSLSGEHRDAAEAIRKTLRSLPPRPEVKQAQQALTEIVSSPRRHDELTGTFKTHVADLYRRMTEQPAQQQGEQRPF